MITMKFNGTEEAIEFGKVASKEEVALMKRVRVVCVNAFENMFDSEDFDLLAEIATQGQLMREAVEASNYN
jgi:hypothetical protein